MLEATKQIVAVKNIETPDERHAFEHASLNVVNLPGVTIARTVYQPGSVSARLEVVNRRQAGRRHGSLPGGPHRLHHLRLGRRARMGAVEPGDELRAAFLP